MMLHVLFATALSASPALPTDSVRNASRSATVRRDTTIAVPRDTTITAAKQAPPSPAAPAGSNVSSSAGASTTAPTAPAPSGSAPVAAASSSNTAAPAAPANTTTSSGGWTTTLVKSSTVVVSTSPSASTPPAAAADRGSVQQAGVALAAPDKPTPALIAAGPSVASASAAPHAEPATAPAPRLVAPADASAVAPRPAETSKRVDARTVVSIRSSERIEPLYSVPLPSTRVRAGAPSIADSIVVYKRERTLRLFYRGVPVKSYFVALGANPVGDKQRAGDMRTPEGLFHINAHNPASKYHLALRISYPDDAHRARAAAIGADPGGDIMIHGLAPEYSEAGKDQVTNDWTNGCIALSNAEIEELWRAVPDGTPIQIKP